MSLANRSFTLMESAARTADSTIRAHNDGWVGMILVIDATAVVATPSVVFTIQGVDPATSKTWDILASAAITATGTTILRVHPELAAAANSVAKDMLPAHWQLLCDHADADSITYAVGVNYCVG